MHSRRSVHERAGGLRSACLIWMLVKEPDLASETSFPAQREVSREVNLISREQPCLRLGWAGESRKVVKMVRLQVRLYSVASPRQVRWALQHLALRAPLAVR